MISQRGIEPNLDKTAAVQPMQNPKTQKEIFTRFGVPRVLITANGTQFTSGSIEDLFCELDIECRMVSVSYPHANGQVDVMNSVIFKGIKKRVHEKGSSWDRELPMVLWSFRRTPSPIRGETPFSLVYGSEVLLPVEIHLETARVSYYDELANEQGLGLDLDLLEEKRVAVVGKMAGYKDKVAAHYNKKVWGWQFLVGDLVLRARQACTHRKPGKLESPWERLYLVKRIVEPFTYELEILEGRQVSRSWNACHMRKYYV
ncbi:hypothetical protein LIER_27888 [Lithospermum erythrorhizon]|uniref:Integrase catalytic domain-containing protein n=1 Tax=Lithospermum erythrorhizon TaxID=34254 RepID=A0AAV3RDL5_LITER